MFFILLVYSFCYFRLHTFFEVHIFYIKVDNLCNIMFLLTRMRYLVDNRLEGTKKKI